MADVRPFLACEVQLMGWGEKAETGAWIQLRLDDVEHLRLLRGLDRYTKTKPGTRWDMLLAVPADESDAGAAPAAHPPATPSRHPVPSSGAPSRQTYGEQARALKLSGFCRSPDVWRALGTDDEFLAWLRTQPCATPGPAPFIDPPVYCGGDVVAAHVRRIANGAGMGAKPKDFSAIPLCDNHHRLQHQHGESALGGKEWFDRQRIQHVETWAWHRLRHILGVESLRDASPARVRAWAESKGVGHLLPREYRGAA